MFSLSHIAGVDITVAPGHDVEGTGAQLLRAMARVTVENNGVTAGEGEVIDPFLSIEWLPA